MISLSRSEPNLSAYLSIRESPFPVEILSILLYMLSLELLEMEGSLDFLLFHTDLKSEDSSVNEDSAGNERELAASSRSPSEDCSGEKPYLGPGGSSGRGGISGRSESGNGGGIEIPGGGGGKTSEDPSESSSTLSKGSFTTSYRSSPLFNILRIRKVDESISA